MPRDPQRISKVLAKIEKIWRANPDWRFGQVFVNALEGNDVPFYIEDDKFLARLMALEKKVCPPSSTTT